jgi:DNA repair protein RadC
MHIYDITLKYSVVKQGETIRLDNPDKVVKYMQGAFDPNPCQETVWVIPLDTKHQPIGRNLLTRGTVNQCLIDYKELFKVAILTSASAIILIHNHPSGDPSPSTQDIQATLKIKEMCKIMEIDLTDHIIIGTREADPLGAGFYSCKQTGIF